jgi:hypothetical protein
MQPGKARGILRVLGLDHRWIIPASSQALRPGGALALGVAPSTMVVSVTNEVMSLGDCMVASLLV